jgi:hypothetical protein
VGELIVPSGTVQHTKALVGPPVRVVRKRTVPNERGGCARIPTLVVGMVETGSCDDRDRRFSERGCLHKCGGFETRHRIAVFRGSDEGIALQLDDVGFVGRLSGTRYQ